MQNPHYRYPYGYKNNNNKKKKEKGLYQSNVDYNTPQVQCVTHNRSRNVDESLLGPESNHDK
jgi:hypothetical protein